MKTLLCSLNSSYTHTAYPLYCLKSAVKGAFNVETAQFTVNQRKEKIVSSLVFAQADCYMFSCYIWNITETLAVCSDLKKIKDCIIVLGGSEVAYAQSEYLKFDFVDAVVSGEGEAVITPLLTALENGENIGKIENVFTKDNCEKTVKADNFDFSMRAFPYTNKELDEIKDKIVYYETSRGCIYNCAYCISHLDKKMRAVGLEKIKDELEMFHNNGVKLVKFIDRTFNFDAKRAEEIIEYIIKRDFDTRFHFEIRAEIMTERLIELLNSAKTGKFQLEIGLQSVNGETLKEIGRKNETESFSAIFRRLRKPDNVHLHADLIYMLPHESYSSFAEGFDFLYALKPHMLQLGAVKILKGTRLFEKAKELKLSYSDTPPFEVLKTGTISFEEKTVIDDIAYLTDKLYNSGAFTNALNLLIKNDKGSFLFFESLVFFARANGFFDSEHSKKDMYRLLLDYSFSNDSVGSALAFDYLLNVGSALPDFLGNQVEKLEKQELWDTLISDGFMKTCPSELKTLPLKELIKYTDIYDFAFSPFSGAKETKRYVFFRVKDHGLTPRFRYGEL